MSETPSRFGHIVVTVWVIMLVISMTAISVLISDITGMGPWIAAPITVILGGPVLVLGFIVSVLADEKAQEIEL